MDPIKLRLTTFALGVESQNIWLFTPARNMASLRVPRQAAESGEGRLRRRPINERDAREIKLPVALLLDDTQWLNFKRLLHAHKIEWQRSIGGKLVWVEYDLDVEATVVPAYVEDKDRLRSYTIKLVQSDALWYTDFENEALAFTDNA